MPRNMGFFSLIKSSMHRKLHVIENKLTDSYYKLLRHIREDREIVKYNDFSQIVLEMLKKYSIKENITVFDVIEEYSVNDVITVIIAGKGERLYYIIVEPHIDYEKYYDVISMLLKYGGEQCCDLKKAGDVIRKYAPRLLNKFLANPTSIMYHYVKLRSGYGPLYPINLDPYVEEIACSQKEKVVYVIHRKYIWYGWMKTNIMLDDEAIESIVLALARKAGRHLSLSTPIAEGLTEEGIRVALTFSREVSRHGTSFVLRKRPWKPWTITKVIDNGMLNPIIASYLWLILELRGSILIVGGMSSGKTTLLQSLLTLIPPSRKVVTIEDTPEIAGSTGLWDPLVVRPGAYDAVSIDEYKLLKFALRRRADYIVVGEVRGVEARLLIQASRLGHGTLATFHAEDAYQAIERLIAPPISIPRNLLSSIWVIVVMDPGGSLGTRRVKAVYEIDEHAKSLNEIIRYDYSKSDYEPSNIKDLLERSVRLKKVLDKETLVYELENRVLFLSRLVNRGVFDINELSNELQKFYSLEEGIVEVSRREKTQ